MTILEQARLGIAVKDLGTVAARERISPEILRQRLLDGRVVLPMNLCRKALGLPEIEPCGIGQGLRTKVNANIGTSQDFPDLKPELEKLKAAVECGADAVMDLSTGGDIRSVRRQILESSRVPVGTVPIYDAAVRVLRQGRSVHAMTAAGILRAVRDHVEQGVDFITVHCGVTRDVLRTLEQTPRVCGIVSRGGTFLATWIGRHGKENPLYEQFDEVLAIARAHDVTLSLGDGLRPGAQADAFDRAQVHELNVLAELAARAHEAGVQVMIEGPGHVPLHQIEAQVRLQKELCHGAPFYVLGPLVTDVAPGYDHITAAIGGAVAAAAGADFICYVTPMEHLGLPEVEHVREGVIAARIAGHAADIAKGVPGAAEWDRKFSELRRARDWQAQIRMSMDPKRAAAFRKRRRPGEEDVCSMCGELCVFKIREDAECRRHGSSATKGAKSTKKG